MTFFVYSKDRDKRITYSNTVLQTMREHQLCRNSKKYEFWFEQVVFLEHVVSRVLDLITQEGGKLCVLTFSIISEHS